MPTYEYACKECGDHLEVVQSFKDDALTECPSCSGPLRKVFSAAGIIFKGSGWHVKDYASSSNRGPAREAGASGDGDDKGKTKDGATKDGATKESSSTATGTSGGSDASSSPSGSSGSSSSGSGSSDAGSTASSAAPTKKSA